MAPDESFAYTYSRTVRIPSRIASGAAGRYNRTRGIPSPAEWLTKPQEWCSMTSGKFSSRALLEASHNRPSMTSLQKWAVATGIRDPYLWPDGDPENKCFRLASYRRLLKEFRKAHPVAEPVPAHGRGPAPVISNERQVKALAKDAAVQLPGVLDGLLK
jgi:hypothetical protein